MTTPAAQSDQQKIWRHFQNAAPESFAASHPRLDWLLAETLRRTRGSSAEVLNIGIGDGYFERQAQARGLAVTSLDPDADAVARLVGEGIAAQVGQIENLPYRSEAFDCVVVSEVLEHLADDQRLAGLAEVARVLREGGWLLGTVPYREILTDQETACPGCGLVFHRWGHQRSFDEPFVRDELSAWFDVVQLGRTAFVPWRGRGARGWLKSLARWSLAKLGEPIAFPTLYWVARKVREPAGLKLQPAAATAPA
jgi:SAM-dependent methyltransferase